MRPELERAVTAALVLDKKFNRIIVRLADPAKQKLFMLTVAKNPNFHNVTDLIFNRNSGFEAAVGDCKRYPLSTKSDLYIQMALAYSANIMVLQKKNGVYEYGRYIDVSEKKWLLIVDTNGEAVNDFSTCGLMVNSYIPKRTLTFLFIQEKLDDLLIKYRAVDINDINKVLIRPTKFDMVMHNLGKPVKHIKRALRHAVGQETTLSRRETTMTRRAKYIPKDHSAYKQHLETLETNNEDAKRILSLYRKRDSMKRTLQKDIAPGHELVRMFQNYRKKRIKTDLRRINEEPGYYSPQTNDT